MAFPRGSRAEPAPRRKLVSDAVMGMLLFVFTEVMLFSGLISAHAIVKSRSARQQMWPPFGQPWLRKRARELKGLPPEDRSDSTSD